MTSQREVSIRVPVLARVEGEGALELRIRDGAIETVHLRIYEPPRLFEKLLEGRSYAEVPDIVARICGICPVAYQMSAVQALERAFETSVPTRALRLRRAMYCGEWIQSHALHIHLLAAPDFLGAESAIALAATHADVVRRGLYLQGLGNRLIDLFGGRSVHPVGVCVGGFHRAPDPARVDALVAELRAGLDDARALVEWTASLPLPADPQEFVRVALHDRAEYPMYSGRIASSEGLDIDVDDFDDHFAESHVAHSTALHASLGGRPYLVGPLARIDLAAGLLPEPIRSVALRCGLGHPATDMFRSIVARAVEIWFAIAEAVRILEDDRHGEPVRVEVRPQANAGCAGTEAPRGLLWHRYETAADGTIVSARIVPPTSQNQARIEDDLRRSLESFGLDRSDDELRQRGEMVIRNYDPCISCATHFIRLEVDRR